MGFEFMQNNENQSFDFNTVTSVHCDPPQKKSSRFMTLSILIHLSALLAVDLMTGPLVEQSKIETVSIELDQEQPLLRQLTKDQDVVPTQGSNSAADFSALTVQNPMHQIAKASSNNEKIKTTPTKNSLTNNDTDIEPTPVVDASSELKQTIEEITAAELLKAENSLVAKNTDSSKLSNISAKTKIKAVPSTIDDIDAPQLDKGTFAKVPINSDLNEDFNEDYSKIDQTHSKALESEKQKMNAVASSFTDQYENELKSIEHMNQQEAERFSKTQKALHESNDKDAGFGVHSTKGLGEGYGSGAGNNVISSMGTELAGGPSGHVRSLNQLRQMPGNPRPDYNSEERRRGDQGSIAFYSYVSKEGSLTKFQMRKSTGFRNLDAKTLAALKKWRFYPGQEGWVELPFRWDLKGGVQQDGGRLRTSVSQK